MSREEMTTGKRIKKVRMLRGMTQKEFGELVGLVDSRVRQYEADIRTPKEDAIKKFAEVLSVPYESLMHYDVSNEKKLIQTLFEIERTYSIKIERFGEVEERYALAFDNEKLNTFLEEWKEYIDVLRMLQDNADGIPEEFRCEYETWCYEYRGDEVGENDNAISNNIKRIRKERRMTQTELAEKAGIHPVSIKKYETGRMTPTMESIEKIANALQCGIEHICGYKKVDVELKHFEPFKKINEQM